MRPRFNALSLVTVMFPLFTAMGWSLSLTSVPAIAQSAQDLIVEANRLVRQGTAESLQRALTIYQELGDRRGETQALILLSRQLLKQGNYPKVIELAQRGIVVTQARQEISERERRVFLDVWLTNLAYAYQGMGQYDRSLNYLQQSLDNIRGGVGSQKVTAVFEQRILADLADCLSQALTASLVADDRVAVRQYTDQLLQLYREAQKLSYPSSVKEFDNRVFLAFSQIIFKQTDSGHYLFALRYAEQFLITARNLDRTDLEGEAIGYLAMLHYVFINDDVTAIRYYEQQLTLAKANQNAWQAFAASRQLSSFYARQENYDAAIRILQERLQSAKTIKDVVLEAQILNALASTYEFIGDGSKTIEYAKQALTVAQQNQDLSTEFDALGILSRIYIIQKSPLGLQYAQQSLAVAQEFDEQLLQQQQFINANAKFPKEDLISTPLDRQEQGLLTTQALAGLGYAYSATGDFANAIKVYERQLTIAQSQKVPQALAQALTSLGSTLVNAGRSAEALPLLMQAITTWESLRAGLENQDRYKVSIFERQTQAYEFLQKAFVALNKPEAALEIAERGRTRAFVELVAQRIFQSNQQSAAFSQAIAPLKIDEIRRIAKQQNATLVEYSIVNQYELLIWVIKPTGDVTLRRNNLMEGNRPARNITSLAGTVRSSNLHSTDADPLKKQIGVFYNNLRSIGIVANDPASPGANQSFLRTLHEELIQPITDLLPIDPNQHVIFIPQGVLNLVPFAALQDTDGHYLIQQHTIRTAPSIQVLALTHKQRQKHQNSTQAAHPLIVGNPTMPKMKRVAGRPVESLAALPGAEQEARVIAHLLNAPLLTGNNATETTIKQQMPHAQLIHLATHGLLDDQRGIGSEIALAPSSKDDGLLTAEEILDMKLQADLVVLSACDTGRGKITGDGVIGLSRSLISAGTPSVIVSFWAVPDAPTASLMAQFYQNLQKQPDRAQALRQAMLATMQQHPNPRDWAAFTLIGETRSP